MRGVVVTGIGPVNAVTCSAGFGGRLGVRVASTGEEAEGSGR